MREQFIPYKQALELKNLGFNEECLEYYSTSNHPSLQPGILIGKNPNDPLMEYQMRNLTNWKVKAPLWQQAFDWFIKEKRIDGLVNFDNDPEDEDGEYHYGYEIRDWNTMEIIYNGGWTKNELWDTRYKARQALLEKLIEIVKLTL